MIRTRSIIPGVPGNTVSSVASIASLGRLDPRALIFLKSYYEGGDFGGGWLSYSPTANDNIDEGCVFAAPAGMPGRLLRVLDGEVTSDGFGFKRSYSDDNPANTITNVIPTERIQAWINAANSRRLPFTWGSCKEGEWFEGGNGVVFSNKTGTIDGGPLDGMRMRATVPGGVNQTGKRGGSLVRNLFIHFGVGRDYNNGNIDGTTAYISRNLIVENIRLHGHLSVYMCQIAGRSDNLLVRPTGISGPLPEGPYGASNAPTVSGIYLLRSNTFTAYNCRVDGGGPDLIGWEIDSCSNVTLNACASNTCKHGLVGVARHPSSVKGTGISAFEVNSFRSEDPHDAAMVLANMDQAWIRLKVQSRNTDFSSGGPYRRLIIGHPTDPEQASKNVTVSTDLRGNNVNSGTGNPAAAPADSVGVYFGYCTDGRLTGDSSIEYVQTGIEISSNASKPVVEEGVRFLNCRTWDSGTSQLVPGIELKTAAPTAKNIAASGTGLGMKPNNAATGALNLSEWWATDTTGFLSLVRITDVNGGVYFQAKNARGTPNAPAVLQDTDLIGGLEALRWIGPVDQFERTGLIRQRVDGFGTIWEVHMADHITGAVSMVGTIGSRDGLRFALGLRSRSPTGGVGYATGAGGAVPQTTDKSTGVTLDKVCGQITMNAATLNAGVGVSFTLTNSAIAVTDLLVLSHVSGGNLGDYRLEHRCANGSATIRVTNTTGGNLSEAIVIGFAILKAVAA